MRAGAGAGRPAEGRGQEDSEECAICLAAPREPVALPCGHSYCRRCVEALERHAPARGRRCPLCRRPLKGVSTGDREQDACNSILAQARSATGPGRGAALLKAAAELKKRLAACPGHAGGHEALGDALRLSGRLPEAAQAYRRASELEPDRVTAWFRLGATLYDVGDEGEGAAAYLTAVSLAGPADFARRLQGLVADGLAGRGGGRGFLPDEGEPFADRGREEDGVAAEELLDAVLDAAAQDRLEAERSALADID